MKVQFKVAGMLAVLLLVATVALTHGPKVSAAATGKITGTVKLDGTPPHMKGIDMSKDPYCAKYHANSPASTGTGGGGQEQRTGECRSLYFAGLVGRGGQPEAFHGSGIRPERLHVHAARDRHGCRARTTR